MQHAQKQFQFTDKKAKLQKFESRKFTFEVDEYLKKRFGNDYSEKLDSNKSHEISISLKDAEKDLPFLLVGFKTSQIDLMKQDYDEILKVYAFFLMYKKNAVLRELEYNNETFAYTIEQAKQILSSMPELISQLTNSGTIPGS